MSRDWAGCSGSAASICSSHLIVFIMVEPLTIMIARLAGIYVPGAARDE